MSPASTKNHAHRFFVGSLPSRQFEILDGPKSEKSLLYFKIQTQNGCCPLEIWNTSQIRQNPTNFREQSMLTMIKMDKNLVEGSSQKHLKNMRDVEQK
jgi:hypothetical protein